MVGQMAILQGTIMSPNVNYELISIYMTTKLILFTIQLFIGLFPNMYVPMDYSFIYCIEYTEMATINFYIIIHIHCRFLIQYFNVATCTYIFLQE